MWSLCLGHRGTRFHWLYADAPRPDILGERSPPFQYGRIYPSPLDQCSCFDRLDVSRASSGTRKRFHNQHYRLHPVGLGCASCSDWWQDLQYAADCHDRQGFHRPRILFDYWFVLC